MHKPTNHLMIVAGEASGDLHGSHLVDALRTINPDITFSGLGGPKMKASGVELYEDLTRLAVVGFVEVIKHLGEIKRIYNLILKKADELKPAAVILIDYPGFNLRLARALKKKGIKVIYYISPQIWAWKENRVHTIRECVDKMLVLFEFERDFYAKHGVEVEFVGHPLIDSIKVKHHREDFLQKLTLSPEKLTIGLMPGSRQKEIEKIMPSMVSAAGIIDKENPQKMQFLIFRAPNMNISYIDEYLLGARFTYRIIDEGHTYDGMNACNVCMVASGTATLESAILNKPMVVVYKTSLMTYLIAKNLIKIPYIGLVNVVAQNKIVPECIQSDATPEKIAGELKNIFANEIKIEEIKSELKKVKSSLGDPGASRRAAEKILQLI